MKIVSAILRRKRGILLFIAAFVLPLLFGVLISIDTFSKRQKTTRKILESNLRFSGWSALDQFEEQLIELEGRWLNNDFFSRIFTDDTSLWSDTSPDLFIIDKDHLIIYPETGQDRDLFSMTHPDDWSSEYRKQMDRAKSAELSSRSFSVAVQNYQMSLGLAETPQQEAMAIDGLARSHLAGQNFNQAIKYYQILRDKYSRIENLSGHPYGISAPLQLYTIGKPVNEDPIIKDSITITYQMMRDGYWQLGPSEYFFFKAEYDSILGDEIKMPNPRYERILEFTAFLQQSLIPRMEEINQMSRLSNDVVTRRTLLQEDDEQYLISYEEFNIPDMEKEYYGGIRWKLDTLIANVVPSLLNKITEETGLEFIIVDNNSVDLLTGEQSIIPEKSLSLSFSDIPLPWILIAIQPGYKKLESDVKVQIIIYGLLLVIIIILMFFGVFMLLRDISREADSMLLKTEFVHNVSHELKTPLSLIRLYGETLLLKENLSEKTRKEGLQIITKESERLSYMINNILDFSKIEMGKKEFDIKAGKLDDVVLNTLDSYRYHLEKKGFEIEVDTNDNIPIVLFDKNALEGILINLLSNAIKFSIDTKKVMVRLKNIPEGVSLEVADEGIGIPADELPSIFDRFYRANNSSDFEARGSGLGLTLVKHAVDAHGWQIKVKSQPSKGSVFSIIIPLNSNVEGPK